jgi:hypothetical protein
MANADEIGFLVFICFFGGTPLLALFCFGCCYCLDAIGRIRFEPVEARYQPVIQQPYV